MSSLWLAVLIFTGTSALAMGIIWAGLRVEPDPLELSDSEEPVFEYTSFSTDLPTPVRRYFELTMGPDAAVMDTTTIIGRGQMRLGPLWVPVRFRANYRSGKEFHRVMEVMWFGKPILKGLDTYLNGVGKLVIAGKKQTGSQINQAQNLALWAEAIWTPTAFALDPDIHWEQWGNHDARLVVPFEIDQDELIVRFSLKSGLPEGLSAKRYRGLEAQKTGWDIQFSHWTRFGPVLIPARSSVRWEDAEQPWLFLTLDDVRYNQDVSAVIPLSNSVK